MVLCAFNAIDITLWRIIIICSVAYALVGGRWRRQRNKYIIKTNGRRWLYRRPNNSHLRSQCLDTRQIAYWVRMLRKTNEKKNVSIACTKYHRRPFCGNRSRFYSDLFWFSSDMISNNTIVVSNSQETTHVHDTQHHTHTLTERESIFELRPFSGRWQFRLRLWILVSIKHIRRENKMKNKRWKHRSGVAVEWKETATSVRLTCARVCR